MGVLAAAAHHRARNEHPALIVVPTNLLLEQYVKKDGPAVGAALGLTVRGLKGRNRYVCDAAPAFKDSPSRDVPSDLLRRLGDWMPGSDEPLEAPDRWRKWLGCPGRDEHVKDCTVCDYEVAKALLDDADIIITNAHILIIDRRLKGTPPRQVDEPMIDDEGNPVVDEDGEPVLVTEMKEPPRILPDYCALFVDEAHTLEDVMRDFTASSIPLATAESMGEEGAGVARAIRDWNNVAFAKSRYRPEPHEVVPDLALAEALQRMSTWKPERGRRGHTHRIAAADAAGDIFTAGASGAFVDRHAVLWFDPAEAPCQPRLVSTQINLSSMGREILTAVPTGLVSATVPKTLRSCLGLREATYADVGHPFDYARQATLGYSRHSGAYRVAQDRVNLTARAAEVDRLVRMAKGGALVLFSAFRDLEAVHDLIGPGLQRDGFRVLRQQRDDDKAYLGEAFKKDGNAVLFASDSFATGFDCPGDALRLVAVWKLPFPGLDPVTRAISAQNRARYEDMMLVKVTQAAGRLIRTTTDRGMVHIADARALPLISGTTDPMLTHLRDYRRWDVPCT